MGSSKASVKISFNSYLDWMAITPIVHMDETELTQIEN